MAESPSKRAKIDIPSSTLSENEAVQYDRQIRLWGVDAQQRLRKTRILVVGATGLAAELCKNIVLAGIGTLTLMDDQLVSVADLSAQFFLGSSDLGFNRAQASIEKIQQLNPNVKVTSNTQNVLDQPENFFTAFDIVCVTDASLRTMSAVNETCRKLGVHFFSGQCFGFFGFIFADLLDSYSFSETRKLEKDKFKKDAEDIFVTNIFDTNFVSLNAALAFAGSNMAHAAKLHKKPKLFFGLLALDCYHELHPHCHTIPLTEMHAVVLAKNVALERIGVDPALLTESYLRDLIGSLGCELSPVAAIVGGVFAGEVIKVVSGKDMPLNNFFFYDGIDSTGLVEQIGLGLTNLTRDLQKERQTTAPHVLEAAPIAIID